MSFLEKFGLGKGEEKKIIKPGPEDVKRAGKDGGMTPGQLETEQQKEKTMKRINDDKKLKRTYDFWFNKTDETGKNMQDKLVEFLMENPKVEVGYNKITKEFVNAKMAGASSSVA